MSQIGQDYKHIPNLEIPLKCCFMFVLAKRTINCTKQGPKVRLYSV